jgi:hypothetical protein
MALLVDPQRRRRTVCSVAGEAVFTGDQLLPLDDYLAGLRLTPAELFAALEP